MSSALPVTAAAVCWNGSVASCAAKRQTRRQKVASLRCWRRRERWRQASSFRLPYLTVNELLWSAQARASFIGLDARHTPAHLMRAACQGVIFNAWWAGRIRPLRADWTTTRDPGVGPCARPALDAPVRCRCVRPPCADRRRRRRLGQGRGPPRAHRHWRRDLGRGAERSVSRRYLR